VQVCERFDEVRPYGVDRGAAAQIFVRDQVDASRRQRRQGLDPHELGGARREEIRQQPDARPSDRGGEQRAGARGTQHDRARKPPGLEPAHLGDATVRIVVAKKAVFGEPAPAWSREIGSCRVEAEANGCHLACDEARARWSNHAYADLGVVARERDHARVDPQRNPQRRVLV
jgi:hypothetical protein